MGLFELLRALSFLNSTVFTFLLFFWLAPGYETATEICGWCHGCLWILLSLLSWRCAGARSRSGSPSSSP